MEDRRERQRRRERFLTLIDALCKELVHTDSDRDRKAVVSHSLQKSGEAVRHGRTNSTFCQPP